MCIAFITTLLFGVASYAAPGINQTLSFQGRLLTAGGGVVPDGHYNIQFKIYQGGTGTAAGNPGGTLKWTENYVRNNDPDAGVEVKNGYFSVNLGSVNPFGTQVDWNDDTLYLSMNVGGSDEDCETFGASPCTGDGEMLPMKRMTATPFAINSAQLGGKTADNFVQLAQGVQTDASTNTSSIFINKTGSGNLIQLQNTGVDVFTVDNSGNIAMGNNANHTIGVTTSDAGVAGRSLAISAGGGGSGTGSNGGDLTLQGGAAGGTNGNGGSVTINAGAGAGSGTGGTLSLGTSNTSAINIGGAATQTATINTGGVNRATFDTSGKLALGNGVTDGSPVSSFTIQATSNSGTGAGTGLTIQAGNSGSSTNGANLTLSGGIGGNGVNGLVTLTTPTFQTVTNDANCYTGGALVASSCTIDASSVNNSSAIIVGTSTSGQTVSVPDPAITTAGRIVYITAANDSSDFTLSINGGGTGNLTSMRQNTSATLVWNGGDWTVAGASNSTTLQSAYDNTLQSAGGAELIVSSGTNANGLTIRDSSSNPVSGTLLEVQNASASTLFSVNSNVPEYATNGGAETTGGSSTTFPANTWAAHGSSTVTRHTPANQYVATGQASVKVETTNSTNAGASNMLSKALTPNMTYNVSFGTRLASGSPFTDMYVGYSLDDSGTLTACKTNAVATISSWTKVSCSFKTPASGITSSNAIIVRQTSASVRTFYIDNLSVTIAGNQNYASDGNVNSQTSFDNNLWATTGTGSTVVRIDDDGQEKSDSAQATTTLGGTFRGIQNQLSIKPLPDTLYRVSVYAKSSTNFTDFSIRYTLNGSTFTECVDYNTQTVSTTLWTEVSCYIRTPTSDSGTPVIHFTQAGSAERVFKVDAFEMNLATNTSANVQIGGGSNGGQTTLFTLDQGASAPISDNNDALLGSMYYDTTLGKIQCYESDGWGACGSSPDNIITISPEYTNAVMNGTGVGTMTSDFCSNTTSLTINTGICSPGQTQNFYKWTSPQTNSQTYSIYVTYQLPGTFKSFASGQTTLKARSDNGSNGGTASVKYKVMKKTNTALTDCGTSITVSENTETQWKTGTAIGAADPSTCGFSAGDSIVFKIDVTASKNATAYVSDLGFTFSNN